MPAPLPPYNPIKEFLYIQDSITLYNRNCSNFATLIEKGFIMAITAKALTTAVQSTLPATALKLVSEIESYLDTMNGMAGEIKEKNKQFGAKVEAFDTFITATIIEGLALGLTGAQVAEPFYKREEQTKEVFKGLPRYNSVVASYSNLRLVIKHLDTELKPSVTTVSDKGVHVTTPAVYGKDLLKGAKGARNLQSVRKMIVKLLAPEPATPAVDNTTPEMLEYASLLAGACDWDRKVANTVLAKVFAEATKNK